MYGKSLNSTARSPFSDLELQKIVMNLSETRPTVIYKQTNKKNKTNKQTKF